MVERGLHDPRGAHPRPARTWPGPSTFLIMRDSIDRSRPERAGSRGIGARTGGEVTQTSGEPLAEFVADAYPVFRVDADPEKLSFVVEFVVGVGRNGATRVRTAAVEPQSSSNMAISARC